MGCFAIKCFVMFIAGIFFRVRMVVFTSIQLSHVRKTAAERHFLTVG